MTTPTHGRTLGAPEATCSATRSWWNSHLWEIQPIRDALVLLSIIGLIYLGYLLSVVTVPLLVATALAYLFEPLVQWLTRGSRGRIISRPGAAVLIILIAVLVVIVPLVLGIGFGVVQGVTFVKDQAGNVQALVRSVEDPSNKAAEEALPGARWRWLRTKLLEYGEDFKRLEAERKARQEQHDAAVRANGGGTAGTPSTPPTAGPPVVDERYALDLSDPYGVTVYKLVMRAGLWAKQNAGMLSREALATGASAISLGLGLLASVGLFLFGAFLTAFFFFFICVSYGRFLQFWQRLIPERKRYRALQLLSQMDNVIAGFIRGRLIICALLMIYYTLAFLIVGAPAPLILGPLFGALHLIPYAACLSVPIVMVLMWLEPATGGWQSAWWWTLAAPVLVYLGGQGTDDYVLSPTIQGRTTNMDTPTILFASLAGGILGGIYGLLVAIPFGACLKILLKEFVFPRIKAWGEGRASDPLPLGGSPPMPPAPPA